MPTPKTQAISELDRSNPASNRAKPGAATQELIDRLNSTASGYNALISRHNALVTAHNDLVTAVATLAAKLNADVGVSDTNYAAPAGNVTISTAAATGVATENIRDLGAR